MSVSGQFKDSESPRMAEAWKAPSDRDGLFRELAQAVTERFERLTGLVAVIGMVNTPGATDVETAPVHPLCAEVSDKEYCRASWQSHMAGLALRCEVRWHQCRFGKYCAVVPVAWHKRPVAACQLVGPDTMTPEVFEHHVELLDVLIENFVARHAEGPILPPHLEGRLTEKAQPSARGPLHDKVRGAIEHIDEHLTDANLSEAGISRHLEMNATYLAHLFAEQVGVRMNRYIAIRRIELAKKILTATNWQVKRIARESGYANPDWFSHVFHAHTGMKPGEYRRHIRQGNALSENEKE